MLSGAHYYVHNNVMEDYLILKNVPGINISFSSGIVFLLGLLSVIPFAVLWQYSGIKLKHLIFSRK